MALGDSWRTPKPHPTRMKDGAGELVYLSLWVNKILRFYQEGFSNQVPTHARSSILAAREEQEMLIRIDLSLQPPLIGFPCAHLAPAAPDSFLFPKHAGLSSTAD